MLIEREAHLPLLIQHNIIMENFLLSLQFLISLIERIKLTKYEVAGAKDMLQSQEDEIRQK
jgi:hypothetical protein